MKKYTLFSLSIALQSLFTVQVCIATESVDSMTEKQSHYPSMAEGKIVGNSTPHYTNFNTTSDNGLELNSNSLEGYVDLNTPYESFTHENEIQDFSSLPQNFPATFPNETFLEAPPSTDWSFSTQEFSTPEAASSYFESINNEAFFNNASSDYFIQDSGDYLLNPKDHNFSQVSQQVDEYYDPSLYTKSKTAPSAHPDLKAKPNLTTFEPKQNDTLIAEETPPTHSSDSHLAQAQPSTNHKDRGPDPMQKEISINFNNVAMIEYIRFISRITNKNFIFDDEDLQFNVTIVSEEPTSVENLMAALLQELRIRDLSLLEQGNNIIIHRNQRVRSPSRVVLDGEEPISDRESEIVTRVYRLNTLDPIKASEIVRPLLSDDALVEVLRDSNNLIITDLVTSINKISQLIKNLDSPNTGITLGQYVVRNTFVETLLELALKILQPIAQGNPFVLVPHHATNSIYIVSNPFIVEKALAILENLDLNEGHTKIISLDRLNTRNGAGNGAPGTSGASGTSGYGTPGYGAYGPGGAGTYGANGLPGAGGFGPGGAAGAGGFGPGGAGAGAGGQYGPGGGGYGPGGAYGPGGLYGPGGPGGVGGPGGTHPYGEYGGFPGEGLGGIGVGGRGTYPGAPLGEYGTIGSEGRSGGYYEREFAPGGISSASRWARELPAGHIERTLFYIYKLRYRKGDSIGIALRKIAASLHATGTINEDLIAAINSSQWLEGSNSLIFTGTVSALEKIKELVAEVDVPLGQVFIEMLILDTTIEDSLNYGVEWGTRFGGGSTAGGQAFLGLNSTLSTSLDGLGNTPTANINGIVPGARVTTALLGASGYNLGIIGQNISHNGLLFNSIGALVRALHSYSNINIIMNPKLITEDNNTAEVFVGETDRYKTQSISNDLGSVITNNFQFIDVGTTLRVTPLIGNNGIITLDIITEVTNGTASANSSSGNSSVVDVNLVPVLTKSRTTTRIHLPDGCFAILSGLIRTTESRSTNQIPCLGAVPFLGGMSKQFADAENKRNFMIFLQAKLVDTEDQLENLTRRQQDIMNEKSKYHRSWNFEIDEFLNFINVKKTEINDIECVLDR